ncbi:MAG: sporulation protein YunB [Erysipelotrichaceae bacterium]|nr:sporulation protein YunB [Erysipelotrichaceae bacterium]
MRFRSYKKKKFSAFFTRGLIILVIAFLVSLMVINYFSSQIKTILLPIAEARVSKYVNNMINKATGDILFDKELLKINKNSNDEVEMVTYNTYEVTKLIDKITMNIQDEFNGLEYGKVNDEFVLQKIPFGVIFGNVFLRNLGPKINIRFDMIGNVLTNIETEVKPYGINNAYVETRVFIEANARIIIPFVTKNVKITNVIPISINIYQGKVPNGYITSFNK